jgi:hypothetical protein
LATEESGRWRGALFYTVILRLLPSFVREFNAILND